jgi:hypothetical protein
VLLGAVFIALNITGSMGTSIVTTCALFLVRGLICLKFITDLLELTSQSVMLRVGSVFVMFSI